MGVYDVRSVYRHLYHPETEPVLVQVPPLAYCMVDGEGEPEDEAYTQAVRLLFAMTHTLKEEFRMHSWYHPFSIAPLECLWSELQDENRRTWRWTAMVSQPDWVTEEIFLQVRDLVAFKEHLATSDLHLGLLEEGLCITMLHIGSYEDEMTSLAKMQAYCDSHQLKKVGSSHREIYLSSKKDTEESPLKTVLRFPVERL